MKNNGSVNTFLYNIHLDDFIGKPIHYLISGRRPLMKYRYFIEAGLTNILVDGYFSSIIPMKIFSRLPSFLRLIIVKFEYILWLRINPEFSITMINKAPKDYHVFAFGFKTGLNWYRGVPAGLENAKSVVMHLSHYFVRSVERSTNFSRLGDKIFLAADHDVSHNAFFKSTFFWYKKELLKIPFCVSNRFFEIVHPRYLSHQVLVTGTVDLIRSPDDDDSREMFKIYGIPTLNRFRFNIISHGAPVFIENRISVRDRQSNSLIEKFSSYLQKKYHNIDFPTLLSSYVFYCTGNELCGFPALSSFEAAACGALVILDRTEFHSNDPILKVFPSFDGGIDNLYSVVNSFIKRELDISFVVNQEKKYVRENYSESACILSLQEVLRMLSR